jgi:hypothetical protein
VPFWLIGAWFSARAALRGVLAADGGSERRRRIARGLVPAGVLATLLAMLGFDVLIAGGDHFEYRALSFLPPLCALALLWSCLAIRLSANASAVAVLAFSILSGVLPWTIYSRTNALFAWPADPKVEPIAAEVPWPMRPVAESFDALERWLIPRGIGVRHYEHRAFWLRQLRSVPSRAEGERVCSASDHPVAALTTIGIPGWVLLECAILDLRGLADYVIARAPSKLGYLGHDRKPPLDYVQQFQPNVFLHGGNVRIYPRPRPLTDERIREIERQYWRAARGWK